MLPLQISAVVAALSLVVIAVATVHALWRAERATARFIHLTGEIRRWVIEANELTRETREALAEARGVMAPVGRVVKRFETLGTRTADLSAGLLEEVETPLRTAMAVIRGVKSITAHFTKSLSHRFTEGRSATNGGSANE